MCVCLFPATAIMQGEGKRAHRPMQCSVVDNKKTMRFFLSSPLPSARHSFSFRLFCSDLLWSILTSCATCFSDAILQCCAARWRRRTRRQFSSHTKQYTMLHTDCISTRQETDKRNSRWEGEGIRPLGTSLFGNSLSLSIPVTDAI